MLAYSSRIVLIKTCLVSVPVYLLSFLKFPKWAIKLLESQMGHCLWNSSNESHRYHLASWQQVNMKQEFGGLGVPNLRELYLCLLGSWVRWYSSDKDKIWKKLVDYKYNTSNPNIFTCKELGVSNFWKGVIWAARVAKMGNRWQVGNEVKIHFREDVWLESSSWAIQYWEIYCIINEHNKTIAELWNGTDLKCTFRRCVDMRLFLMWEEVVNIASTLTLSSAEDELIWCFHSSGIYSS
jgi:hypothetical protein